MKDRLPRVEHHDRRNMAQKRSTDDLIKIAAAAGTSGAWVVYCGLKMRPVNDLIRIAAAGEGCVFFRG
jgi:hypothetical protein